MKCIILAAGEGTRMRPLTTNIPKVMIPIANRPIMEHLLIAVREAGIQDFIVVVGYGERSVRGHFGDGEQLGVSIEYVTQKKQRGTADALRTAEELITERFLLLNGDIITRSEDIEALSREDAPSMGVARSEHPEDYGVVTVDGDVITSLEEKTKVPQSDLINTGAYVLDPSIFEHVRALAPSPRGEFELTDALARYIDHRELRAYSMGYWLDVGYPWDLLDANAATLASIAPIRAGNVEPGVTLLGDVSIGEGTTIKSGTYIEGPCIIGSNCRIGPNAYIRRATSIGNGCHVGHASEVKNSIVMDQTNIPHLNYVGDSIIGSSCNLGAGTIIANVRHDRLPVKVGGRSTRRMKFGAIIGDNVQFGINCSVNVGCCIGSNSRIAPHAYLDGTYGNGSYIR